MSETSNISDHLGRQMQSRIVHATEKHRTHGKPFFKSHLWEIMETQSFKVFLQTSKNGSENCKLSKPKFTNKSVAHSTCLTIVVNLCDATTFSCIDYANFPRELEGGNVLLRRLYIWQHANRMI